MLAKKRTLLFKIFIFFTIFCSHLIAQSDWQNYISGMQGAHVLSIARDPDDNKKIYIGILGGGFFYLDSNGLTWKRQNDGLGNWNINCLMVKKIQGKTMIYAGTDSGIYTSEDLGNWDAFEPDYFGNFIIYRMRDFYCHDDSSAFLAIIADRSNKSQRQLKIVRSGEVFTPKFGESVVVYDAIPYIGSPDGNPETDRFAVGTESGYYYFNNDTIKLHNGKKLKFYCLAIRPNGENSIRIYASTNAGGRYFNRGDSDWWRKNGFLEGEKIKFLEPFFFKCDDNEESCLEELCAITDLNEIYVGQDKQWDEKPANGLPRLAPTGFFTFPAKSKFSNALLGNLFGLYETFDSGVNWTLLDLSSQYINNFCVDVSYNVKRVYAAASGGIFWLDKNGWENDTTWHNPPLKLSPISTILMNQDKKYYFAGTKNSGLYYKDDLHKNWKNVSGSIAENLHIVDIVGVDSKTFYIASDTSIYKFIKRNNSFEEFISADSLKNITDIDWNEKHSEWLFIATSENKVFKLNLMNKNLKQADSLPDIRYNCLSFLQDGNILLTGSADGIYFCDSIEDFKWKRYDQIELDDVKKIISPHTKFDIPLIYFMGMYNSNFAIHRHIFKNTLISSSGSLPNTGFQNHPSFCIDPDDPYKVYLGTGGNGVNTYQFEKPQIANLIDIPDLDFGKVAVGYQKDSTLLIINRNIFMPLSISVNSLNLAVWQVDLLADSLIYPEDTLKMRVTFSPKEMKDYNSRIIMHAEDIFDPTGSRDSTEIFLSGVGQDGKINFKYQGKSIDTLQATLHTGEEQIFEIEFEKTGNAGIESIQVINPNPPFFLIGDWQDSLTNNVKGKVKLKMYPTTNGIFQDSVKICYCIQTDYPEKLQNKCQINYLYCLSEDGILKVDPDTIDFKEVPINNYSFPKKLYLSNQGNIPLILDSAYFNQGKYFKWNNGSKDSLSDTLAPGSVDFAEIYFDPKTVIDTLKDTLNFIYHDKYNYVDSAEVFLHGIGDTDIVIPIPPIGWDFEDVCYSHLPEGSEFEFFNNTTDFELKLLTVETGESSCFKIENFDIVKVKPGETSYVNIKFDPKVPLQPELLKGYQDSCLISYSFWKISSAKTDSIRRKVPIQAELVAAIPMIEDSMWEGSCCLNGALMDSICIKNLGNRVLNFQIDQFEEDSIWEITSPLHDSIEPDSAKYIKFQYTPHSIEGDTGSLTVHFNDSCGATSKESIKFYGEGQAALPEVAVLFDSISEIHIHDSIPLSFEIKNNGNLSIESGTVKLNPDSCLSDSQFPIPKINPAEKHVLSTAFISDSIISLSYDLEMNYLDLCGDFSTFIPNAFTIKTLGAILKAENENDVDIDSVHFKNCNYNYECDTVSFNLINSGNLELSLDSIVVSNEAFKIETAAKNIKPGNVVEALAIFCPDKPINYIDSVNFHYHDSFQDSVFEGMFSLKLSGKGTGSLLIVLKQDTIKSLINDSTIFNLWLKNTGNISCKIDSIYVNEENESFEIGNDIVGQNLPPGDSLKIDMKFFPEYLGADNCILHAVYTDVDSFKTQRVLTNSIIGLGYDNVPPQIVSIGYATPEVGKSLYISSKIYDIHSGLINDSIFLMYRESGTHSGYQFAELEKSGEKGDSLYEWQIIGENITEKGVDFYIEASDLANNRAHYPSDKVFFDYISPPVKVDKLISPMPLPTGNEEKDYRLISIPLAIDSTGNSAVRILFQSLQVDRYDESNWRCADLQYFENSGIVKYVYLSDSKFSDFLSGRSFFILLHEGWPGRHLISPGGYTLRCDEIFKIPLHPGWNLIANPFNFPISVTNISLSNTNNIKIPIKEFTGKFQNVETEALPWTGYAVHVPTFDTLLVLPNLDTLFDCSFAVIKNEKPNLNWYLEITGKCGNLSDENNLAGVSTAAGDEFDNCDYPELPFVGSKFFIAFPHEDWKKGDVYYAHDIKANFVEGNIWKFLVYSSEKKTVQLKFESGFIPENHEIRLLPNDSELSIDLKKTDYYQFIPKSTNQIFYLLIGTKKFVNDIETDFESRKMRYDLKGNFPNPFNSSTKITMTLPVEDIVTVVIYDILGNRVISLKKHEKLSAGIYELLWNGKNNKSQDAGSGIYFCRMTSKNFDKTIKMILIR